MTKPEHLPDDVWEDFLHPAPAHRCYECRYCKPLAEDLRAKGRAISYCTAKLVVSRTSGIKISGRWYELVSAKQVISCKLFEPVKGGAR